LVFGVTTGDVPYGLPFIRPYPYPAVVLLAQDRHRFLGSVGGSELGEGGHFVVGEVSGQPHGPLRSSGSIYAILGRFLFGLLQASGEDLPPRLGFGYLVAKLAPAGALPLIQGPSQRVHHCRLALAAHEKVQEPEHQRFLPTGAWFDFDLLGQRYGRRSQGYAGGQYERCLRRPAEFFYVPS